MGEAPQAVFPAQRENSVEAPAELQEGQPALTTEKALASHRAFQLIGSAQAKQPTRKPADEGVIRVMASRT